MTAPHKTPRKTPIWKEISRALRVDIAEKIYTEGDKLPTEAELAARFGVNRHTVRHALKSLIEDGLLRSRRGAGVYVTAAPTDYPIGRRVRFHQNVLAGGQTPQKRILHIDHRPASDGEAQALNLPLRAPLVVYHGISLADDHPIALFSSHFPAELLPGMADALRETSGVTEALKRCGVSDYTRISTRISARIATATQANHLHNQEGAALIYTTGVNVDPDGTPVEFGQTWFVADRVTLTFDSPD